MRYEYKNDETGQVIEVEFSMEEEKPAEIERDGIVYRRVWPFESGVAVKVPYGFTDDSFRFDKRPREKRKYK